jgi:predicted amidohydrolase YtcJ
MTALSQGPEADLVLFNGAVHSLAPGGGVHEAVAICGGRIAAIGTTRQVCATAGVQTRLVDLRGRMAMPGLIDFHLHLMNGAINELHEVRLDTQQTFEEVLARIQAAAQKSGARDWIVGGRFGHLAIAAMSSVEARRRLDAVSNGRPVLLRHSSGHSVFANSKALAAAGIDRDTPDPPAGHIARDEANNEPTGLLYESAMFPAVRAITPLGDEQLAATARHGVSLLNSFGITGFLDAHTTAETLRAFKALDDAGALTGWAGFCLGLSDTWESGDPTHDPSTLYELSKGFRGPHMRLDFAKIFLDGVPSLRTAAMLDLYPKQGAGDPVTDGGVTSLTSDQLAAEITKLDAMGLGVKVHAIGDRAILMVLDAVEVARSANGPNGPAHQIAHMNFIRPQDIPRLKRLNVIADLCPPLWYPEQASTVHERMVGAERYGSTWPVRTIVESGATAATGSDWPTVFPSPNPWPGLAGLLLRRDPRGKYPGSHNAKEAITLETALPLYTRNPARALGLGSVTGQLSPGFSADLIVLDRNLFEIKPEEIADTRVLTTLFEGRIVFGDLE